MSRIVLDASVTMSWYFSDERDELALKYLAYVERFGAIVPAIWPIEVLNIMLIGERRGRSHPESPGRFIPVLSALDIRVSGQVEMAAMPAMLDLARKHGLTMYDAAYLGLSLEHQLPLATLDKELVRAALRAGISVLQLD